MLKCMCIFKMVKYQWSLYDELVIIYGTCSVNPPPFSFYIYEKLLESMHPAELITLVQFNLL